MNTQLPYALALLRLPGFGPVKLAKWMKQYSELKAVIRAPNEFLYEVDRTAENMALLKKIDWQGVERDLNWVSKSNHHILTDQDKLYPKALLEISARPPILFVKGNLACLSVTQLAIVGSRKATKYGQNIAFEFAQSLSRRGLSITSGLAFGIDQQAHLGALSRTGETLAVLANGLDQIYPKAHEKIAEKILEKGCLISEFPIGVLPKPTYFPRRNRLISGVSVGTLVVEANLKSGSLITARYALEHNREIFAIPGSIHVPQTKGVHALIQQGAKLVEKVEDILEEIDCKVSLKTKSEPKQMDLFDTFEKLLDKELQDLLHYVGDECISVDQLVYQTDHRADKICSMLFELELNGYVVSVAGGYKRKRQLQKEI